jgi:hypothetical protein
VAGIAGQPRIGQSQERRKAHGLHARDGPPGQVGGSRNEQKRTPPGNGALGQTRGGTEHGPQQRQERSDPEQNGGELGSQPQDPERSQQYDPEEVRVALDSLAWVVDQTVPSQPVIEVAEADVCIVRDGMKAHEVEREQAHGGDAEQRDDPAVPRVARLAHHESRRT